MECWALIFTLTFGTTRTAELSSLFAGHALPQRKFCGTPFSWRLIGPPGILTMNRRNKIWNQTRSLLSCGAVPQPTAPPLATRRHTQSPSMYLRRVKQQDRLSCNWAAHKAVCTVHFCCYHRTRIRSYTIAHGSNVSYCSGIDIWNDVFFVEADLFQHDVNSHTS